MAVDNEKLARSRPGATAEVTNGPTHPAGLYRHKESGEEAITLHDPLYGDAQSAAFVRAGFEFVREARPDEIHQLPLVTKEKRLAEERSVDPELVKGMAARLSALEAENAQLKGKDAADPETAPQVPGTVEAQSAGMQAVSGRMAAEVGTPLEDVPTKPLKLQNLTELTETAQYEGLEVAGLETKSKLISAIEAHRAASEEESGSEEGGQ